MAYHQPFEIAAFHSCDREVGLRILNGEEDLIASENEWDWLGPGIYFWEQNPGRALEYAIECASGWQKNKTRIKTPFVLGAIYDHPHIEICVRTPNLIKGYFLPRPINEFNPYLKKKFPV